MSDRLKYLREQHGAALLEAFRADVRNVHFAAWERDAVGDPLDDDAAADLIFKRFREADPTRTGACTQWLIRLAIAGNLPAEDLPKARETLEAFVAYKRRLPADDRDIGRYETLGAVWKAVEPFVLENAPTSGKDEDRREREAARAESDILLEQDGWTVAIPKTERAACWWGRGTRWCTAATEAGNMFSTYNERGPLVVFVRPDGQKFQYHAHTNQFMRADDTRASVGYELQDLITTAMERLPALFACLFGETWSEFAADHPRRSDEQDGIAVEAMTLYGLPFQRLPTALRTRAACIAAQDLGYSVLGYSVLSLANSQTLDREICLRDFAVFDRSCMHIPPALIDRDMIESIIPTFPFFLQRVPSDLRDADICRRAVDVDPRVLQHVPKQHQDDAMLISAVGRRGTLLSEVPEERRSREICLAAVTNDGAALCHVPNSVRDEEIYAVAVSNSNRALMEVPQSMRSLAVYRAALKSSPFETIRLLPPDVQAQCQDLLLEAVRWNPDLLSSIHPSHRSREICLTAVSMAPSALEYVPARHRDAEMCLAAIQVHGFVLRHLSEEECTVDLCLAAVRQNQRAFRHVPKSLRSAVEDAFDRERAEMLAVSISDPAEVEAELERGQRLRDKSIRMYDSLLAGMARNRDAPDEDPAPENDEPRL